MESGQVVENPLKVFCCYAREDESWLRELKIHLEPLQRTGLITLRSDIDISAGANWKNEIHQHLNTAQIILLLISPDFMASDYCYSIEMKEALIRHKSGKAQVIPIILRPTAHWQEPPLGDLQALPRNTQPITRWEDKDEAFLNVTEGIRSAARELTWQLFGSRDSSATPNSPIQSPDVALIASRKEQGHLVDNARVKKGASDLKKLPDQGHQTLLPKEKIRPLPLSMVKTPRQVVWAGLAIVIILVLAGGIFWFTHFHNSPGQNSLAGVITEFTVPTPQSSPNGITMGSDGNLWFTELVGNKVGRITTSGKVTEYSIPTANSLPQEITANSDRNLWFTEANGKIGRVTTNGTIIEFSIPTLQIFPMGITDQIDGTLWFTESFGNKIGRITGFGRNITEFAIPTSQSSPGDITVGPDGNLWFTEYKGNKIGRITPSGNFTEFPVPTLQSGPNGITAGPDGNLWFTESDGNKIGYITPNGNFTEFPVPTFQSRPDGIIAGPDGNLWFTEFDGNKIGRVTPNGNFTEFPILTYKSHPVAITAGSDSNLWFTEFDGNKIGRITVGS